MEQKQKAPQLQENKLRYKLSEFLSTKTQRQLIPLNIIEIVLEIWFYLIMLKFSIDYFSHKWIGREQPIFSYLDISFYSTSMSQNIRQILLYLTLTYITLYWLVQLIVFLNITELPNLAQNIKKGVFMVTKYILFVPFFGTILSLFTLQGDPYRVSYENPSTALKSISIILFIPFTLMIFGQTFVNFQFLKNGQKFTKYRKSAYIESGLLCFVILSEAIRILFNENIYLVVVNGGSLLLGILFVIKQEHLNPTTKCIELSFLAINELGVLLINLMFLAQFSFSIYAYGFVCVLIIAVIINFNTYSLEFEISNINKWPTTQIKLKYTNNMRLFLRRKQQFWFQANIHGYMEVHRHKCEEENCPSRSQITQFQQKRIDQSQFSEEQIIRCQNVVKNIYCLGQKETPINDELLLQNSIFLYEKGEKEVALKTLLMITTENLSFDRYYKYIFMRETIHQEMVQMQDREFMDLVSELRVKYAQDQITRKMEEISLTNLQFWSVLNEEHPDFTKLTEVATKRIELRHKINKYYQYICNIAYNQKITSLYVNYLEAIQNDEELYQNILDDLKQQHQLDNKILLQDWASSSHAVMVVSVEEDKFGKIIDINSSGALLLGYQKYQLIDQSINHLLPHELGKNKEVILNENHIQQKYVMVHKSGYLLRIQLQSQSYNSMETGMACVVHLQDSLLQKIGFVIIDKDSEKILGITSSFVAFVGIQNKSFEEQVKISQFFKPSLEQLIKISQNTKDCLFRTHELFKSRFDNQIANKDKLFRVKFETYKNCIAVGLQIVSHKQRLRETQNVSKVDPPDFQFTIQATLSSFKYVGLFNNHESYVSQFSQLTFAETFKKGPTMTNYGQGINTLRLKSNIIQVIEQNEEEDVDGLKRSDSQTSAAREPIPQKEEEEIFASRKTFTDFISSYNFGYFMLAIMLLGKVVLIAAYISSYFMIIKNNNNLARITEQMAYTNLITGEVAKQLSLLHSLEEISRGTSLETVPNFIQTYNDNINHLSLIRQKGGNPFNVTVTLGQTPVTFLDTEFTLSFIDNANVIAKAIAGATTPNQISQALQNEQITAKNYLKANCATVKEQMIAHSRAFEADAKNKIDQFLKTELFLVVGAFLFLLVITAAKLLSLEWIKRKQKQVFEIFLDISDVQIQRYSSKSQKFLTSLHVEDINGQIDVEEEVEHTRKISNSTFTKIKRFKNINHRYGLIIKFLLIGFVYMGFSIHTFIQTSTSLDFEKESVRYYFLTSKGDYVFYSGLAQIQQALATGQPLPTTISKTFIEYYYNYFKSHYKTYANVEAFHSAFSTTMMNDVCNGSPTSYGSSRIPQSCQLPRLYPNGSYLIFNHMAFTTDLLVNGSSLTQDYFTTYYVLSKTHRLNTQNLISAHKELQNNTRAELTATLVLWCLVLVLFALLFVMIVMRKIIDKVNLSKDTLTILPLSVVRQLPRLVDFCNMVVRSKKRCECSC